MAFLVPLLKQRHRPGGHTRWRDVSRPPPPDRLPPLYAFSITRFGERRPSASLSSSHAGSTLTPSSRRARTMPCSRPVVILIRRAPSSALKSDHNRSSTSEQIPFFTRLSPPNKRGPAPVRGIQGHHRRPPRSTGLASSALGCHPMRCQKDKILPLNVARISRQPELESSCAGQLPLVTPTVLLRHRAVLNLRKAAIL